MMIRPAQWQDAQRIGELWLELVAFHQALDTAMPSPAPDGAMRYASRISSHIDDPFMRTFVAEEDGQLVGYITGMILDMMSDMFQEDRAGMVGDIYVVEAHRSHGVGRALLSALEEWFLLRDIKHYEWYVASKNEQGKAFWHKNGGRDVMIRMRATLD